MPKTADTSATPPAPPPSADAQTAPDDRPLRDRRQYRWGLIGAAACLLIGIGLTWWFAGLRNRFYPDNFGVVVPGKIYRSAQIHRRILRRTLVENHIAVIIELSSENSENALAEKRIAREMGITQLNLVGLGGNGIGNPDVYPAAIKAIVDANRAGKAVLVHCQSGAQRTGGVVAIYRMLIEGKSEEEAIAEARRFHHSSHSNPLLFPFIESHLPEWKAQLEADGVLPRADGIK